jgi:hypothetical protein
MTLSSTLWPSRRQMLLWVVGLPLLAVADGAAVVVEGQTFERQVHLAGADLLLNGTGIRGVAWFKAFIGALYLSRQAGTAAAVFALPGPKRLQIRMLFDVPAEEFAKAFRKGMTRNATSSVEVAALATRMSSFEAAVYALGTVRKGDRIDLDFDPARGTLFSVNGTLHGQAWVGEDFYAALLRAFIGELPYDEKLKAGLLGLHV